MENFGMGGSLAYLDLIVLGLLLGFIIMRLRSVLGRRTGEERQRPDHYTMRRDHQDTADSDAGHGERDNVTRFPGLDRDDEDQPSPEDRLSRYAEKGSPLAQGLLDIQLADREFDPAHFLSGARGAYEMIVTAFAEGDRQQLQGLLSDDVMADFDGAIGARESRGETMEFTFVGLNDAKMTEAVLEDRVAEITVRFVSEVISVTKNEDGAVIEGDPSSVRQVTDIWTFARDSGSASPNWLLVATAG